MPSNEGRSKEPDERNKEEEAINIKDSKKEVQDKDPLKFLVQIGDCTPQIYHIIIAFNPNIEYSKLNLSPELLKGLVEDTNSALIPVLTKYCTLLKGTEEKDEN